jgi:hypothetical protein
VRAEALWQIVKNVITRIGRDNLMLVAAGVAFYAMTAIFRAIADLRIVFGSERRRRSLSFLFPMVQGYYNGSRTVAPACNPRLLGARGRLPFWALPGAGEVA